MKISGMLLAAMTVSAAARADFQLGAVTLPDDCAALRAPAALPPELEKQNGWHELAAVIDGFPRRESNLKTPEDFQSLTVWTSIHPANEMVTAKASMLLRRHATGMAAWDRFLNAPVIAEPPAPTSYPELLALTPIPLFRAGREAALGSAWRVRVLQAQGKSAEAWAEWNRVRAGLARAQSGASTLVSGMILGVYDGVVTQPLWELSPTRAEVAAMDARGESFSTENWRRVVLTEMRFLVCCLPSTDDEIRQLISTPAYGADRDKWPKDVATYRATVHPVFGTPVERARESVARVKKLGAPGLESVTEFKRRLADSDAYAMRQQRLSGVGMADAAGLESLPYGLEWARVIRCRQSRVIAALRAYAGGHAGAYPEKLSALVPDYLSALPKDPYSGADFCYDPKWPALWSVGPNGRDDGGAHTSGVKLDADGDIVCRPLTAPVVRPGSPTNP